MSYCVNCGVELEKSERKCPLCGTEVVNPADTGGERVPRPYSSHIERLSVRVDRRYTATFISLLLLIPTFVTMFTNLVTSGRLTWSLYVLGSMILLFAVALLPFLVKLHKPYAYVAFDGAAAALFLLFIDMLTEQTWFWRLGLPIAALGTLFALLCTWLIATKRPIEPFTRIALGLTGAGVTVVLLECILLWYRGTFTYPHWSPFVLFPCIVLSACLLLLNRKAKLKSELRRRFFI